MKKKILKIVTILIIFSIVINSLSLISFAENNTYNQKIISAQKVRNNGISNFPESYQILLNKLVEKNGYANWKFKAFYTDIDWNELVENETTHMKNTIYNEIKYEINYEIEISIRILTQQNVRIIRPSE